MTTNPRLPLFWALDFRLNPLSSLIGPSVPFHPYDLRRSERKIHALEEIVLPGANAVGAAALVSASVRFLQT